MIDFGPLNQVVLTAFAESLTYTVAGMPKVITGAVTRPDPPLDQEHNVMRPRISSPGAIGVTALSSAVVAAGIVRGSTVVIDGKTYKVTDMWPDDGGMTTIEHRT